MKLKAKCSKCSKPVYTSECLFRPAWGARFKRMFRELHGADGLSVDHKCGTNLIILSQEDQDWMNCKVKAANS